MTSALQRAIAVVGELPVEDQDMIADVMMRLARIGEEPAEIDPDHLGYVRAGVEEARRGEFATAAEIEEAFAAFGREGANHAESHPTLAKAPDFR